MIVKNAKVPVLIEENYKKTIWCSEILNGIGKIEPITLDELDGFEKNSVVPIIGSTSHFLLKCVKKCSELNLRAIIVGTEIADFDGKVSSIKTNRKSAISGLVEYYKTLDRNNIALVGVNTYSNLDTEKRNAFVNAINNIYGKDASKDVYYCKNDSQTCIETFLEKISLYNAVICSNDYFATNLIFRLQKIGIKVPDDVMIVGYGNSAIGAIINPPLTTIAPKHYEMGIQTRKIYTYLTENPEITALNLLVDYDVLVRKSTDNCEFKTEYSTNTTDIEPCMHSIFDDSHISRIMAIDSILGFNDTTMTKILLGIANDISYAVLAEQLYLSDSAFRYKLNKIFSMTKTQSKSELKQILESINFGDGIL